MSESEENSTEEIMQMIEDSKLNRDEKLKDFLVQLVHANWFKRESLLNKEFGMFSGEKAEFKKMIKDLEDEL
jgi:hypothetical protein